MFSHLLFVCHQRACSTRFKVVSTIWSVGLLVPAISGPGEVSLATVCLWGGDGEPTNCAGARQPVLVPRSALWHYTPTIIILYFLPRNMKYSMCELQIKICFKFILYFFILYHLLPFTVHIVLKGLEISTILKSYVTRPSVLSLIDLWQWILISVPLLFCRKSDLPPPWFFVETLEWFISLILGITLNGYLHLLCNDFWHVWLLNCVKVYVTYFVVHVLIDFQILQFWQIFRSYNSDA